MIQQLAIWDQSEYCLILAINTEHYIWPGVGMSLFCFYFHPFFILAILLFLAYYAQYFARS